ncbi:hypothetical protein M0805_001500 [Coniferiporia weirii]|nr:hypothetical protein M0805_001500 [Coniferiporia weirii]
MTESPLYRHFSLSGLKEIRALLDLLTKKAGDAFRRNRKMVDTTEKYVEELLVLRDTVVEIYNQSSIYIEVGLTEEATLFKKVGDADIQVVDAVASTRSLLIYQENVLSTATSTIASVSDNELGRNADLESHVVALQEESQKLAQAREGIQAQFNRLFAICEDQLRTRLQVSLGSSGGKFISDTVKPAVLDIVKLSFHGAPFQVQANDMKLDISSMFALFNNGCDIDADYARTLENLGQLWVDDFLLGPELFAEIGKCYVRLLNGFLCFLEAEIALLPVEERSPEMHPADLQLQDLVVPQNWMHVPRVPKEIRNIATKIWKGIDNVEAESARDVDLVAVEARETRRHATLLKNIYALASKDIERERTRLFSVALCGMVKSGFDRKSLFLSAVLGHSVLPTDELPSTAWPCRIQHVQGQTEPHLVLYPPGATQIFQEGIEALRSKLSFVEEDNDWWGTEDFLYGTEHPGNEMTQGDVESIWKDVAPATRANWEIYKQPNFLLPTEARGDANVNKLLAQMNDVVRLCRSFSVDFRAEGKNWPVLTVEFDSLRDEALDGQFEFYDLPGMGESGESYLGFQELIGKIALEVNAIVPIVSLKEVSKNDWRTTLPRILETSTGLRKPSLIICTHRDQVEDAHLETQTNQVLNVFNGTDRVEENLQTQCVSCSSRLGFGARTLLNMSRDCKPEYSSIFNDSVSEACRSCARHVLGGSEKTWKKKYDGYSNEYWISELNDALEESGLTGAMNQFTVTMARTAQKEALLRGVKSASHLVQEISALQQDTLLRLGRTKAECDLAEQAFAESERKIKDAKEEWKHQEGKLRSSAMENLNEAFVEFERECVSSAGPIFRESEVSVAARHKDNLSYQNVDGTLKFARETSLRKFLRDILRATKVEMEAKRSFSVPKMKSEIIGGEIKQQLAILRAKIEVNLGSAQRVLFNRLDIEMDVICKFVQETPVKELFRSTIQVVDELPWFARWIRIFWGKYYGYAVAVTEADVVQVLQDEVIRPYVASLRASAEITFGRMMKHGADIACRLVDAHLNEECLAYELELSRKGTELSEGKIASTVAAHMNFVSAGAALRRLEAKLQTKDEDIHVENGTQ